MSASHKTVGAFEAKTHLSQLLDAVQEGEEITITKRGKPVARLVPVKKTGTKTSVKETLAEFDAIRSRVKGKVDIRSYIAEGRKY